MGPSMGTPVTERVYVGPRHKRIYFPGKGRPEPEPPVWTPTAVTSSFSGIAATTAVAAGGVVAAAKAPSLFAIWAPKLLVIFFVMVLVCIAIYFAFFRKKKDEE